MKFCLNNGLIIPSPGYGTYNIGAPSEIHEKIIAAAECGFRHFDTAASYNNEEEIGKSFKFVFKEVCKRSDMFIAGKLSNDELRNLSDGYNVTKRAFQRTLEKLQLDYLDLYLIHWPVPRDCENTWKELNITVWQAMEEIYNTGRIKAIGVSNFEKRHIENIINSANIYIHPMVNQIEVQPLYQQKELIDYCTSNKICVEAWGALKQGEVFKIPELQKLSKKYRKPISQICLKFCEQLNTLPLVKCSSRERMIENLDMDEWKLSSCDMETLYRLDSTNGRYKNYAYERRDRC